MQTGEKMQNYAGITANLFANTSFVMERNNADIWFEPEFISFGEKANALNTSIIDLTLHKSNIFMPNVLLNCRAVFCNRGKSCTISDRIIRLRFAVTSAASWCIPSNGKSYKSVAECTCIWHTDKNKGCWHDSGASSPRDGTMADTKDPPWRSTRPVAASTTTN